MFHLIGPLSFLLDVSAVLSEIAFEATMGRRDEVGGDTGAPEGPFPFISFWVEDDWTCGTLVLCLMRSTATKPAMDEIGLRNVIFIPLRFVLDLRLHFEGGHWPDSFGLIPCVHPLTESRIQPYITELVVNFLF